MNNHEYIAVFVGYASEYPFRDLAKQLRSIGVNVAELDMSCSHWRSFVPGIMTHSTRILFSSQHPYMGKKEYEHIFGIKDDVLNLSGIIDLIEPSASYFVPHDLVTPIKKHEVPALALINGAFMPNTSFTHIRDVVEVFDAGWIGALAFSTAPVKPHSFTVSVLPSEIGYFQRRGLDRFLEMFGPLFAFKPIFKLPRMKGLDHLSDALTRLGVNLAPSETPAEHVIACSDVVVSNGLSSVLAEASYFGRMPVCIIDGIHSESLQRQYLSSTPDVVYALPHTAPEIIQRIADATIIPRVEHRGFAIDKLLSCLP